MDASRPTFDEGSHPAFGEGPPSRPPPAAGPRWEILGELGWGGMGRITLARDRWLARDVALKTPTSERDASLFRHEARITARLEHPGIVPIYEMGVHEDGRPWFAMRLVRGRSLADRIAEARAPGERHALLRHVRAACEAVAFAHARRIVHRDLKPSNIMVGAFGETQVIDWGLAIALDEPGPHEILLGAGTRSAMSPEQARGEPPRLENDVYSLGIILAQVVTGRPAPLTPEARSSLASASAPLASIVERATRPRPEDRYASAAELAEDLGRFLDGERVRAHDYGAIALLRHVVRVWRVPLAVAAVAAIVVVALVVAGVLRISAERARAEALLASALVSAAQTALSADARGEAEVLATHALALADDPKARGVLAALPRARARKEIVATLPGRALDVAGPLALSRTPTGVSLTVRGAPRWSAPASAAVSAGAIYGGGARVILVAEGAGRILSGDTGEPIDEVELKCGRRLTPGPGHVVASFTGNACVQVFGARDAPILRRDCTTSREVVHTPDRDGRRFVTLCANGELVSGRYDADGGERRQLDAALPAGEISVLARAGDDVYLVGTNQGAVLRIGPGGIEPLATGAGSVLGLHVAPASSLALVRWDLADPLAIDVATGASLGRLQGPAARALDLGEDGVAWSAGDDLQRWDLSGSLPRAHTMPEGVARVALSPDGATLAVASGGVTFFDVRSRRLLGAVAWPGGFTKTLAFSSSGDALYAFEARSKTLHRIAASPPFVTLQSTQTRQFYRRMAPLADGSLLLQTVSDGVHRHASDRVTVVVTGIVVDLVGTPDGRRVGALDEGGTLYLGVDLDRGGAIRPCDAVPGARHVALTPDAIAVARADAIEVRCPADPRGLVYAVDGGDITGLVAGGDVIAAGLRDGAVWVWRRGSDRPFVIVRDHAARIDTLAIDPAASLLVSGSWDRRVAFLDVGPRGDPDPAASERAWSLDLEDAFGSARRVAP